MKPVRDSDEDEQYPPPSRVELKTNSPAAVWAVSVMLIVVAAIMAACCVGVVFVIRTA